MEQADEPHQEEVYSLQTSRLASQIDQNILSRIHFVPASGGERKNWHKSKGHNKCGDFFKKFLTFQSTDTDKVFTAFRQRFQQLPFHEQLTNFELSQQLTDDQSRIRWQIAVDVLSAIRAIPEYKNCDALVFGSLVTGLSIPFSGIDISVDIDGDNGQGLRGKSKEVRTTIISVIRESLKVAPSPHNPVRKLFSIVRLSESRDEYIFLREARTGIRVHLTFDNQHSIQSTKLLQFYMTFEPRVKQLIIFLNYWARFYNITESENSLTKWTLNLLVLVFLMERKMIPSVLLLQAIATFQRSERREMGAQITPDLDFCDDVDVISRYFIPAVDTDTTNTPEENAEAFLQLLTKFFEKIRNTDFSHHLVSPHLGRFFDRKDLAITVTKCISGLQSEIRRHWKNLDPDYFKSTNFLPWKKEAIMVLDVFKKYHNTASQCSTNVVKEFNAAVIHTLSILRSNPSTLLDLFVNLQPEAQAIAQPSKFEEYIKMLLKMYSTPKSMEVRTHMESTAAEMLQILGPSLVIPDGLLRDPVQFNAFTLTRSRHFWDAQLVKPHIFESLGESDDLSNWQLKCQVIALWARFAMDYLNKFFTTGLNLTDESVERHEVYVDCPIDPADVWIYNVTDTKVKVKWFEKRLVEKATREGILKARQKLRETPIPGKAIKYGQIKINITYPIWQRWYPKGWKSIDTLTGEAEISGETEEHFNKPVEIDQGKSGRTKDFDPFSIYVLYKLDARVDEANKLCAKPTITFVVQESIEGDVQEERKLARMCVVDILRRTFKSYQHRSFSRWIEKGMKDKKKNNNKTVRSSRRTTP